MTKTEELMALANTLEHHGRIWPSVETDAYKAAAALREYAAMLKPTEARKIGGSYQADGYIISRFTTTAGAERVVFEFNEPKGMLHIFTPEQIEVKP